MDTSSAWSSTIDTTATVGPHIRLNMSLSRWAEPATNQASSVEICWKEQKLVALWTHPQRGPGLWTQQLLWDPKFRLNMSLSRWAEPATNQASDVSFDFRLFYDATL